MHTSYTHIYTFIFGYLFTAFDDYFYFVNLLSFHSRRTFIIVMNSFLSFVVCICDNGAVYLRLCFVYMKTNHECFEEVSFARIIS